MILLIRWPQLGRS